MKRKPIALFIVWIIATISIPYSHLFSVAMHGFALPAYSSVAWAQSEANYVKCWDENNKEVCVTPDEATKYSPNCLLTYYQDSNCQIPISSQSTDPTKYYICGIPDTTSTVTKLTVYCSLEPGRCSAGGSILTSADISTLTTNGFSSTPSCIQSLQFLVNNLPSGFVATKHPTIANTWIVTQIDESLCEQDCAGRTYTTGIFAGGKCAPTGSLRNEPGITYVSVPNTATKVYCSAGQTCYCIVIDPAKFFQGVPTSGQVQGGFNTVSIPGTGGLVNDPAALKNPPRFAANELDCNAPTNATIKANISLSTVPVGTLVNLNGEITKLTNACKGVSYSCRLQYQQGCRVQSGFFSTCVVYNQCNSGDVVVHQSGGKCSINWLAIIGLILIAVSIYGAFVDKALAAKISAAVGQAKGLITLFQSKSQDVFYAGGCNSICGKDTGDTPMTAAPQCSGYPIAAKEGLYLCKAGICGGYEQKDVLIEIKDSNGKVMKRDSTTTDDFGAFSYTFSAPGPAGTYIIVVSTENPPPVSITLNTTSG